MPAKIEFENADLKYIVKSYSGGMSMAALAEEFEVSIPVVRRVLEDAGISIKPRGRYAI